MAGPSFWRLYPKMHVRCFRTNSRRSIRSIVNKVNDYAARPYPYQHEADEPPGRPGPGGPGGRAGWLRLGVGGGAPGAARSAGAAVADGAAGPGARFAAGADLGRRAYGHDQAGHRDRHPAAASAWP